MSILIRPALAIPVGLAQIGAGAPTALGLARGMQGQPLPVDTQRNRFGNKRRLPALGRAPTDDRVVARQMQASIGVTERGEMIHARAHGVGELGHRQFDGRSRIAHRGRRKVHPVGEQRIELIANLAFGPLRLCLPARHRLQARGALQRHRFGEAAVEHQWRLVDLQRDRHTLCLRHEILLTSQCRVEHANEQLHQHGGVPSSHRPQSALHDEHLLPCYHPVEVDSQRIVQQHSLDRLRVQQPGQLVDGRVELGGRHAARVGELSCELGGEELRDLLELRQSPHTRPDTTPVGVPLLADRQQPRRVPQC